MSYTMEIAGETVPVSDAAVTRALRNITALGRRQARAKTPGERRYAEKMMTGALISLFRAQPNRFDMTAGSMPTLRAVMAGLGMLDHDAQPGRAMRPRTFGVTDQMIRDAAGEDGCESPELARYHAAIDRMLEQQVENPTGIPAYKISINEGWLVTVDEITAALGAYRTARGDGAPEPVHWWWPSWHAFLELASKHGGFRVH